MMIQLIIEIASFIIMIILQQKKRDREKNDFVNCLLLLVDFEYYQIAVCLFICF